MKQKTIIVAGGGHAGIYAIKAIHKRLRKHPCRILLVDPQPAHVRKVLLFKGAVGEQELTVPWSQVLPPGSEFLRGAIHSINPVEKKIEVKDRNGTDHQIEYDGLVIAIGSVVQEIDGDGLALSSIENAWKIYNAIEDNVKAAVVETDLSEKERLLSIAVVGGGISGIETVFELNQFMKRKAREAGLDPSEVKVQLIHSQQQLLPDGTNKLRSKLYKKFSENRIELQSGKKAVATQAGMLHFSDGKKIPIGLSVWTTGLQPNPAVRKLGLSSEEGGRLNTDPSYRAIGCQGVYSIGDCANSIDPASGKSDGMTCKEAIGQANRLGKVIASDLAGRPAPIHQSIRKIFCFSLGSGDALVWIKLFGFEVIIGQKVAWTIRKFTWNLASFVK